MVDTRERGGAAAFQFWIELGPLFEISNVFQLKNSSALAPSPSLSKVSATDFLQGEDRLFMMGIAGGIMVKFLLLFQSFSVQ